MKNSAMNINAVYTHKHTSAVLTLSFEASDQDEFDRALSAADDEAEESYPQYSRDLETLTGDDAQLATWQGQHEYLSPELRAAQNGTAKRWKIVDGTGDEHRAYEEQASYPDTEQAARRAFRQLAAAGAPVRLYCCEDDGEDLTEWELENMANQPDEDDEDDEDDEGLLTGPAFRPIAAEASPWANDHLQFARLLRELELADAFTPELIDKLTGQMDCTESDIVELLGRVTDAFDHYQAERLLDERAQLDYRQFADEAAEMALAKKGQPGN